MLITSCSNKESIKLGFADQIISITELSDKGLEKDYESDVVTPILFSNKDEYEKFTEKYFEYPGIKGFQFEKYDLLLINAKRVNPNGDTLYSVDSIKKQGDDIEIFLKEDGKVVTELNQDSIIKNIIYVKLNKGRLSPDSSFYVYK